MRIIAGNLGGQTFDAPKGPITHPMSEKARGALFNSLGDIEGLSVFDPMAGSGALALEAISRGATSALALELDKRAYAVIDQNVKKLNLGKKLQVLRANAKGWSNNNKDIKFDIVLLDPPYDNLDRLVLQKLANHAKANGVVVLSWPGKELVPAFDGLEALANKNYGDIQLVFYRKIK